MARKKGYRPNYVERKRVKNLDALAQFEDFKKSVLPSVQQDVMNGLTAEDLYKKYAHLAAARAISIAATEFDSGRAMSAIKDILDRASGRPTEKREITHKHAELTDDELQALLETEMTEMEDDEDVEEEEDTGSE